MRGFCLRIVSLSRYFCNNCAFLFLNHALALVGCQLYVPFADYFLCSCESVLCPERLNQRAFSRLVAFLCILENFLRSKDISHVNFLSSADFERQLWVNIYFKMFPPLWQS